MMDVASLLKGIEILEENRPLSHDHNIQGIAYHSAKVKEGDLFFCIKGYKTDGHKYLLDAKNKGAVGAVVESIQDNIDIPQYLVSDARHSLALCACNFYNHPSKFMKMIGITATNGKTTTAFMIDNILENNNFKTGLVGTVLIKVGDEQIASDLTTPESLDLQNYIYRMKENGLTHVTMEVSSSAIELDRIAGIDYDIVIFNNISREHIDLHETFENYVALKSSLITNAKKGSWAILNMDCEEAASLINKTEANVLTYGVNNDNAMILCKNLDLSSGRGKFTVEISKPFSINGHLYMNQSFEIFLSVPGYHSVYNAMAAIAAALICKVPIAVIQESFLNFKGVERRFEFIYENDFKIIDDHFANAGNIDVTMETLNFMEYNKLHLVYAIRGSRGPIVNKENAQAIVTWAKKLNLSEIIATKSADYTTEKDIVTDEEEAVFRDIINGSKLKLELYENLSDAIGEALNRAKEDDVILLAGCQGMDYGASIALKKLKIMNPSISEDELFEPLKHRVCGIE